VDHGAELDAVESNPDPSVIQHVTGARATNQIKFTRQLPVLAPLPQYQISSNSFHYF